MAVLEVSDITCHRRFQLEKKIVIVRQDLFLFITNLSFVVHIWLEWPY